MRANGRRKREKRGAGPLLQRSSLSVQRAAALWAGHWLAFSTVSWVGPVGVALAGAAWGGFSPLKKGAVSVPTPCSAPVTTAKPHCLLPNAAASDGLLLSFSLFRHALSILPPPPPSLPPPSSPAAVTSFFHMPDSILHFRRHAI